MFLVITHARKKQQPRSVPLMSYFVLVYCYSLFSCKLIVVLCEQTWHQDYRNFRETTIFLMIGLELFQKKR